MQKTYEFTVLLPNGGPTIKERITANSEYDARRIVEGRYPGCKILSGQTVR